MNRFSRWQTAAGVAVAIACQGCGHSPSHETPSSDASCANCKDGAPGTNPDGSVAEDGAHDGGTADSGATPDGTVTPDGSTTPDGSGTPDSTTTPDGSSTHDSSVTTPDAGGTTTASVLTYHNDSARTGQNLNETVLTPSNVNSQTFGKLFSLPVDSYIYAEPLFVPALTIGGGTHDVVFVATEANSVYAFDANAAGPPLWHVNLGMALSCSDLDDCGDLVPGAGITGTPVIDPTTLTMYLVSLVTDSGEFHHRLHALDLTTGGDKFGGPVEISPTAPGTGAASDGGVVGFVPQHHYQRCALLLTGGVVYIGIGGNAESDSDNHGWVVGYSASNLSPTMTFCASPNSDWVSLWQTGGGLAADADGYIYGLTANGTFDVNTGGSDWGDSALKLDSTGTVVDYFTPHNQAAMSGNDIDFGAANPLLLPDQTGPVAHELIASGKPGILYLINRDDMGHFNSANDNQIVEAVSAFPNTTGITSGIFMSPVYWNGNVYVAGVGGSLQAYTLSAGLLSQAFVSQTSAQFGWPPATASISANGTSAGIVWALDTSAGVLYAYDATNLATELYDTTQAAGGRDTPGAPVKYAVPTIINGHVYVGTQTELDVYGPL